MSGVEPSEQPVRKEKVPFVEPWSRTVPEERLVLGPSKQGAAAKPGEGCDDV